MVFNRLFQRHPCIFKEEMFRLDSQRKRTERNVYWNSLSCWTVCYWRWPVVKLLHFRYSFQITFISYWILVYQLVYWFSSPYAAIPNFIYLLFCPRLLMNFQVLEPHVTVTGGKLCSIPDFLRRLHVFIGTYSNKYPRLLCQQPVIYELLSLISFRSL